MIEVFRVVKEKHVNHAFNGEGAKLYPGRWNYNGTPVVYTSGSLSLAVLESIVHLEALPPFKYVSITAKIPGLNLIYSPDKLPKGWEHYPHSQLTQDLGNDWLIKQVTPVLKVPSAIIASEFNYIINPHHPDFSKIEIGEPKAFVFDKRFWRDKNS